MIRVFCAEIAIKVEKNKNIMELFFATDSINSQYLFTFFCIKHKSTTQAEVLKSTSMLFRVTWEKMGDTYAKFPIIKKLLLIMIL